MAEKRGGKEEEGMKVKEIKKIKIREIKGIRYAVRTAYIDDEASQELEESIKTQGMINPITVVETERGYEVIAGWRRYIAAENAGIEEIWVTVIEGDEKELYATAVQENVTRKNLSPYEIILLIDDLLYEKKFGEEEVRKILGVSQRHFQRYKALLNAGRRIWDALHEGRISMSQAYEIVQCRDDSHRERMLKTAVQSGASAEVLRKWRREIEEEIDMRKIAEEWTREEGKEERREEASIEEEAKRYIEGEEKRGEEEEEDKEVDAKMYFDAKAYEKFYCNACEQVKHISEKRFVVMCRACEEEYREAILLMKREKERG